MDETYTNRAIPDRTRADGSKAGWSLAGKYYKDPAIFEREKEAIIYNSWIFAGHVSQIPNVGDYFLFNLLDESIILVRKKDGDVAAHYGDINSTAKWVLCFAMLLGRLEVFTLLVLLTPAFWRQ